MGKFATFECPQCGIWEHFDIAVDMLGENDLRIGCSECGWEDYFGPMKWPKQEVGSAVEHLYAFMHDINRAKRQKGIEGD